MLIGQCQIVTVIRDLATWPLATTTYVYCLRLLYESLFTAYEYCMSHSLPLTNYQSVLPYGRTKVYIKTSLPICT
jgi:hypothetical protein